MAQESKLQPPTTSTQHRENISIFRRIRNFFCKKKKNKVHPVPSLTQDDAGISCSVDRIPTVFEQRPKHVQQLLEVQDIEDLVHDVPPSPVAAWLEAEDQVTKATGSGDPSSTEHRIPAPCHQSIEPVELRDHITDDPVGDIDVQPSPSPDLLDTDVDANEVARIPDNVDDPVGDINAINVSPSPSSDLLDTEDHINGVTRNPDPIQDVVEDLASSSPAPAPLEAEEPNFEDVPSSEEPRPVQVYRGPADFLDLDGELNFILEEFFLSFSETQLEDMEAGFYHREVERKMEEVDKEVSKVFIKRIINDLEEVLNPSAPQHEDTCFQDCETESRDLPSDLLRETFEITEEEVEDSVQDTIKDTLSGLHLSRRTIKILERVSLHLVRSLSGGINAAISSAAEDLDQNFTTVCCRFGSCWFTNEMLQRFIWSLNTSLTVNIKKKSRSQRDQMNLEELIEAATSSKKPKGSLLWWSCYNRWRLGRDWTSEEE